MNSRRFTARCLPCFRQKDSTPQLRQETAALRDFDLAYVADGSFASEAADAAVLMLPQHSES